MKKKFTLDELNEMVENAEKNGGSLYLSSLTEIPEGFNPTVGGCLDLSSLTEIPEGFNPTVGGSLYLSSLTASKRNKIRVHKLTNGEYREGEYIYADNILTPIKREKKIGEYTYYIGKIPGNNVISDGVYFAHCVSFSEGVIDLNYKKASERGADQYKELTLDSIVKYRDAINMYRIITGACQAGTQQFINGLKETKDEYTIREIIEMTVGQYGHETFKRFFKEN